MSFLSIYWPILVIVCSNTFYHIASMNTSRKINTFASLIVSYLVAIAVCIALFYLTSDNKDLLLEFHKAGWASIVLGICIVGLEFGNIMMYKEGWDISIGSLVSNIALSVFLVAIGILFYKEILSFKKIIGILLCISGIILINLKEKDS